MDPIVDNKSVKKNKTRGTQFSHKPDLPSYDVEKELKDLFEQALARDEFEFCSSILRIRGMEDPGWDPLLESQILANQMLSLIQAPLDSTLRLRLILFVYSHLTEVADLYRIVGNLLRVCKGERHSIIPFSGKNHRGGKDAQGPQDMVERIKEWASEVGRPMVGEIFCDMLVSEVRNAFFHSDYVLFKEQFNIRHGRGVKIGKLIDPRVNLEWLVPRMELGIDLFLSLCRLIGEYTKRYRKNKVVKGRIHGDSSPPVDVELLTHPDHGLIGFQSPPQLPTNHS